MSGIQLIEKQIQGLDDKALAELAGWFADYESSRWVGKSSQIRIPGNPMLSSKRDWLNIGVDEQLCFKH